MANKPVVVGLDGSDGSLYALRAAATQARLTGAPLKVVCAWHPSMVGSLPAFGVGTPVAETIDELHLAVRTTLETEGLLVPDTGGQPTPDSPDIDTEVVTDDAAHALLDASESASLVVVGTRGRGGFAGMLLGSVSQKVLAHAHCPVMVVPAAKP